MEIQFQIGHTRSTSKATSVEEIVRECESYKELAKKAIIAPSDRFVLTGSLVLRPEEKK